MKVEDFETPTNHPFGMLNGFDHASEKESMLVYILAQCIKANDLNATIEFMRDQSEMVNDGLLVQQGEHEYRLTKKSLGLLYSVYGKA